MPSIASQLKSIAHFLLVLALPLSACAAGKLTPPPDLGSTKPVVCKTIDKDKPW